MDLQSTRARSILTFDLRSDYKRGNDRCMRLIKIIKICCCREKDQYTMHMMRLQTHPATYRRLQAVEGDFT